MLVMLDVDVDIPPGKQLVRVGKPKEGEEYILGPCVVEYHGEDLRSPVLIVRDTQETLSIAGDTQGK